MEIKGPPEENRKKLEAILEIANKGAEFLGTAIRKRREMLGLKIYEVANKVGVDPVYITQIEKHGKLPSPLTMQKIIDEVMLPNEVFKIYLKIKYPVLYEKVESNDAFLYFEFEKKIEKLLLKKNKTPEEQETLEREMSNLDAMGKESRVKIQKSIKMLEKIDKLHSKLKSNLEREGKP